MNKETKAWTSYGGNRLLQHLDVLQDIQVKKEFRPIMIELCPTEICESDCPFCSVAGRPIKYRMPWETIKQVLKDFKYLGAKSLEITGGGNPLLYSDSGKDINDIIRFAADLGYKIGIITNSHDLKRLEPGLFEVIDWIRISLIQLEEGKEPEDYNFRDFPYEKLGFSYILYKTQGIVDSMSRTGRVYKDTDRHSIERVAALIRLHPKIKFVRIYGDCTIKGGHPKFQSEFEDIVTELNDSGKMFFKQIGDEDSPFPDSCFIGMLRPYIAANPEGDGSLVYPCNSFVLQKRG